MPTKKTIKLDDRFSIKRDKWSWELIERIDGKEGKTRTEKTYHPNLKAVCQAAIDRQVGDLATLSDIIEFLDSIDAGLKGIGINENSIKYAVVSPAELGAGIIGFSDEVTIETDSGDPGGDSGDFEAFIREALAEWYDGAKVTLIDSKEIGGKLK